MESLAIPQSDRRCRLVELKSACNFAELVPLYTCNRSEYYYVTSERPAGMEFRNRLLDHFLQHGHEVSFEPPDIVSLVAFRALRHLYRVASSLDSMVVGEAQILGQVKHALADAQAMGIAGPRLTNIFSGAFRVARKVRRETPIGQFAVSMVNLVLEDIERHIADINDATVAMVGVGPMSVKLAGHLKDSSCSLLFVNRTESKAAELAARFGGQSISLETFLGNPAAAHVIFTATGAREPIFTADAVRRMHSTSRELLMIDLAVPRDVDPTVNDLENVRVFDIAHFQSQADKGRRERFRAVDAAERIIDQAIARAHVLNAQREFQPVLAAALNEGMAYAEAGMKRLFETSLAHLPAIDRDAIAEWVRQLVQYANRLPVDALAKQADFTRDDCALMAGSESADGDEGGHRSEPHSELLVLLSQLPHPDDR